MNGDIIRQYQSAVRSWIFQYIEPWDKYGRLLISDLDDGIQNLISWILPVRSLMDLISLPLLHFTTTAKETSWCL